MTDQRSAPGIVVRGEQAEKLSIGPQTTWLFAEGADTGGAFSAIRAKLAPGADGARPHHHARASEMFFVIAGAVDVLVGEEIVAVQAGDVVVANAGTMHAFANGSASDAADILIVFGPAIERFDYFRLLQRVVSGQATIADVLASQERFDNWFGESPAWSARGRQA